MVDFAEGRRIRAVCDHRGVVEDCFRTQVRGYASSVLSLFISAGNQHWDAIDDGVGAGAPLAEEMVSFKAQIAEAGGTG
jgi:hypothetical protein